MSHPGSNLNNPKFVLIIIYSKYGHHASVLMRRMLLVRCQWCHKQRCGRKSFRISNWMVGMRNGYQYQYENRITNSLGIPTVLFEAKVVQQASSRVVVWYLVIVFSSYPKRLNWNASTSISYHSIFVQTLIMYTYRNAPREVGRRPYTEENKFVAYI